MLSSDFIPVRSKKGKTGKRGRPKKNFSTKPVRVHEDVHKALTAEADAKKVSVTELSSKVLASMLGVDIEK